MSYTNGLHQIEVERLELDPENPRLPERLKGTTESQVLNWMLTDATLTDLMASIVENSFFGGEALIGIVSVANPEHVVIVEGNRRLASIKILANPGLVEVKTTTVKELGSEIAANGNLPSTLPVYIVPNRQEVANYLGFRHVSGVKQWPVIAKARYLFELYRSTISSTGWSSDIYRQLAKEIGSKSMYVRRLIIGYQLFQKITEHNFFDLDYLNEENFDLSLINDAATKHNAIASYMGVEPEASNPLQQLNNEAFRNVFSWLYQRDKNGETRVGESRNLPVLNKVMATDEARDAFIDDDYTLDAAAALTALADENLRWYLQNARLSMIEAQKLIHNLKSPTRSDLKLIDEIRRSADTIQGGISTKILATEI